MYNETFTVEIVELERLLRWVSTSIKRKGREILSDFEITPPQFEALLHMIKDGELTISELSTKMFLACSTITDLVDRMEKNLLVERVKDIKDRRVVRIRVLEKGHKLIDEVLDARRAYLQEVLYDLNTENKQILIEALNTIHQRTGSECEFIIKE
ncbi:MarR family winged helix-turn-helix transcriptional regulator [Geosporobacter ferrireducens]|uniref:Transcriptional regulator n=1 Tax=Geosporobacter ferrireducens TaxID=1424294 RepID=A0A1D8GP22_9FIRM|nr:MarR family transcriptional regulator [Geosporobacter ferrireducens]AOT72690.1 transcriptional regulator [Geosporobacter ferrireducens]MTI55099.1 MarR family transcriptional regulator [Geosporobacter ferrireducens]